MWERAVSSRPLGFYKFYLQETYLVLKVKREKKSPSASGRGRGNIAI